MEEQDVKFYVYPTFLELCNCGLDESDHLIDTYDPMKEERFNLIQPISLQSIAKVCESDSETIDTIMKEIVA